MTPATQRSRLLVATPLALLLLLLLLLLVSGACGSGKSDKERVAESSAAIEKAAESPLNALLTDNVGIASNGLERNLALAEVLGTMRSFSDVDAYTVSEPTCKALVKGKTSFKKSSALTDEERKLRKYIQREALVVIGRYPRLLYASKVVWPTSWLLDPASPAKYESGTTSVDPLFLKSVLRPKFVAEDGAFTPPPEGQPDYSSLSPWIMQSGNGIGVVVFALTNKVLSEISTCFNELYSKAGRG